LIDVPKRDRCRSREEENRRGKEPDEKRIRTGSNSDEKRRTSPGKREVCRGKGGTEQE